MIVATSATAVRRSVKLRVLVVRGAVVCIDVPRARPGADAVLANPWLSERLDP